MKMSEDVPTFSCLFLFFQARKVSKVIRVTSAPRAARCRDRDDQDEQSTDSVQGYISHMEYLRSGSHQASLALCGGNIWGSNLAASRLFIKSQIIHPHLIFYQFLQRDFILLLLLLLVFFQYKARRQGVSVHTDVGAPRTHPEPTVLIILYGVQEVPAHLRKTRHNREDNVSERGEETGENRQHLVLGMYLAGWILSLSECHVGPNVWGWTHTYTTAQT